MNVQLSLTPLKRGDLAKLTQLDVNDIFHYPGKPNDAFQVIEFRCDKWGEILGCVVAPRTNFNIRVYKAHPEDVVVVYLRTITED
jgi:hypothetical protein